MNKKEFLYNNKRYIFLLLSILIITLISSLLIIQPDIGQTLLVIFSWAVLIFTSGINLYLLIAIELNFNNL